jgi:methyl-accepting chemotaxis protein
MAAKFSFNDASVALEKAKKAQELSTKAEGLCKLIEQKSAEVSELNNTFSANTQIANRFDQLKASIGECVEPLAAIATAVTKMANAAVEAQEASKHAMM